MSRSKSFDIKSKMREVLRSRPDQKLLSAEIAEIIFTSYPEDCAKKRKNSAKEYTDKDFITQLSAEIGSVWKQVVSSSPHIKTIETRPRIFYYSEKTEEEEAAQEVLLDKSKDVENQKLSEHDLYPVLAQFVESELGCFSMRIDEKKSRNSRGPNGNRWLFPDVVGMVDLISEWDRDTLDLAKAAFAELAKVYSFEVKLKLNTSNVREAFFQTVSNSTWANFAYLVALELDQKATSELRMLCSAHSIGVILLDSESPSESQIFIPAPDRGYIEWNSLDRLASENDDAKTFIRRVKNFYLTGHLEKKTWAWPK